MRCIKNICFGKFFAIKKDKENEKLFKWKIKKNERNKQKREKHNIYGKEEKKFHNIK